MSSLLSFDMSKYRLAPPEAMPARLFGCGVKSLCGRVLGQGPEIQK